MPISLIAAVARNGTIGREGRLPWRLPADLARFQAAHPRAHGADGPADLGVPRQAAAGPAEHRAHARRRRSPHPVARRCTRSGKAGPGLGRRALRHRGSGGVRGVHAVRGPVVHHPRRRRGGGDAAFPAIDPRAVAAGRGDAGHGRPAESPAPPIRRVRAGRTVRGRHACAAPVPSAPHSSRSCSPRLRSRHPPSGGGRRPSTS